jgi:cytochrome c oxidase cbb3-type subunit 3
VTCRRWKQVILAGVATLTALGCDRLPGRPNPDQRPILPTQVRAFSELYDQNCAGCHGADGRLGAARPLNDPLYLALVDDDTLRGIIGLGVARTAMPGFSVKGGGFLTDEQVDVLIREMRWRWGRPEQFKDVALPPYRGTGGDAVRGRESYGVFCAGCHGPDGRGTPKGGSIVDHAYVALVSDQNLRSAVIAGRTDLGMPDYRKAVSGRAMSAQEITDVVAWLAGHRAP